MNDFQNILKKYEKATGFEIGIADKKSIIVECSDQAKIGRSINIENQFFLSDKKGFVGNGFCYEKIRLDNKQSGVLYISSDSKKSQDILPIIKIGLENAKVKSNEKNDKINFIKNIILNNILPGDVFLKARELNLMDNIPRVIYIIKTDYLKDVNTYDFLKNLFPETTKDFVITLDNERTVLVKELSSECDYHSIEKTAKYILDTIVAELMANVYIGIGTIAKHIKDLGKSYKEAQMALTIGKVFESDKLIFNYNQLGIGRLIYQIPKTLCSLFLNEVFKDESYESFDSELIVTIQKFFENSLNISEASRKLFVHRNTLVYRLDKIQKNTGLDLRKFDDAIVFKVAMLVKRYLDNDDKII